MPLTYATPITAVSSDITEVGGAGAASGMTRLGLNGEKYVLVKAIASTTLIGIVWRITGSSGDVAAEFSNGTQCDGVNVALRDRPLAADKKVVSGDYFWLQVWGPGQVYDITPSFSIADQIKASTGVGVVTTTAGDAILGRITATATNNLSSIFINPQIL